MKFLNGQLQLDSSLTGTTALFTSGLTVSTGASSGGITLQQNGILIAELRRVGNNNRSGLFLTNSGTVEIQFETGSFSYIRSNNFGIGTATDAGYKLDVNGTARTQGTLTVGVSGQGQITAGTLFLQYPATISYTTAYGLAITPTTAGSGYINIDGNSMRFLAANNGISFTQPTGKTFLIKKEQGGSDQVSFLDIAGADMVTSGYSTNGGSVRIYGGTTAGAATHGNVILAHDGTSSRGNVLIGTTTDLGFKLSVSGSTLLRGSGTTSASYALATQNSSGGTTMVVNDAGNMLIGTTTDAGHKLDVNGTIRGQNGLWGGDVFLGNISGTRFIYLPSGYGLYIGSVGNVPTVLGDSIFSTTLNATINRFTLSHTLGSEQVTKLVGGTSVNHLNPCFDIVASITSSPPKEIDMRIYTDYYSGTQRWGNIILGHNGNNTAGNILMGTNIGNGSRLLIGGTVSGATLSTTRATHINATLLATGNTTTLIGLDIQPTFTPGSFTGLTQLALRVSGGTQIIGSGSTGTTLSVFSVDGSSGRLFDVSDDLSSTLFSVNTIAGLPVIEAFANSSVVLGKYGQNTLVVSGTSVGIGIPNPTSKLHVSGTGYFTSSLIVGNYTGTTNNENTLNVYPPIAGGTGEGGQILLAASGGIYTTASMLDTWQNNFRILKGSNASGSTDTVLTINLQTNNATFAGSVTATSFSGLPNTWLYATRNSSQTIGSGTWADRDVVFNSYSSNNFTYNSSTGVATLKANKTYRITSMVAWSAAAVYTFRIRIYNQTTSSFVGPTTEMIQSTNGTNNFSNGTLDYIFAVGGSDTDITIRTTSDTTALTGEYIRGDLNTQLIIQQIA
jgi:hypothetical protein